LASSRVALAASRVTIQASAAAGIHYHSRSY
jgi:hypothetical protein